MRTWTVGEAKSKLSEILRRSEDEGPQRIGARKGYVVLPEAKWRALAGPEKPLGKWLVEDMPKGLYLEPPDRRDPDRPIPFDDE